MQKNNLSSSLANRISQCLRFISSSIASEFPFFIISVLLLGGIELIQKTCENIASPVFHYGVIDIAIIIVTAGLFVMYSTIFAVMVHVTRKKWLKVMLYAGLLTIFMIETFLEINFKLKFGPGILILLAETNGNEASEFLKTFLFTSASMQCYLYFIVAVIAILIAEHYRNRISNTLSRHWIKLSLTITCLFMSCIGMYGVYHYLTRQSFMADFITRSIYSFKEIHDINQKMETAIQSTKAVLNETITINETDSIELVLVIGESFIKYRSSLYGYLHKTNPLLEKEVKNGNLFVFEDVISPYNTTSESIKSILCCNDLASDEQWYDYAFVPTIFHRGGTAYLCGIISVTFGLEQHLHLL